VPGRRRCPRKHQCDEQEIDMARALKTIGTLLLAFAIVVAVISLLGLPRNSTAATRFHAASTVTISPEQLTRAAGPMPVQQIEYYQ
jgi:hypothetical protein